MAEVAAVVTGTIFALKVLAAALPPAVRLIKRAKLYPNDDQINKDILFIQNELKAIDDEAREQVRDRLERIESWLKQVLSQREEWRMNNGFGATFSKTRIREIKEAKKQAKTMKGMAIRTSDLAHMARVSGSTRPKKQTSDGSTSPCHQLPIKDIVDIAKYQDYDLDRTIQFLGDLTRGLQGSGLPRKSDTIRTPVAASIEHSVEPPQTSVTLPPAAGLDSSPQVTDDDPESILDNMSDCISFMSALSLPDSAFPDVDTVASLLIHTIPSPPKAMDQEGVWMARMMDQEGGDCISEDLQPQQASMASL